MESQPIDVAADAGEVLRRGTELLTAYFGRVRERYAEAPPRLVEAIFYSLMAGGKRLRPALVLECAKACGRDATSGNGSSSSSSSALAAAGAMELIHTFSLVHDDLPAMDNDDLRRGRPTNHKVYGEAMAILAGDAMTTMAFELIALDAEPAVAPALVRELAQASGPVGMIGGQVLDMAAEGRQLTLDELKRLHRMKTGALLTASCRLGAIAAGADEQRIAALDGYGRHLGLAFQIVDDVLDETASPEQMGKATKKDAAKGKSTYPVLLGLERSRGEARRELEAALSALHAFGDEAQGLRALATFVVERTN